MSLLPFPRRAHLVPVWVLAAACLAMAACRKRQAATPAVTPAAPAEPAVAPPAATSPAAPASAREAALKNADLTPVREAIAKYQQNFKQNPFTLPDLVRVGYLKGLPEIPPGTRIQYDRVKATVTLVAQ